MDRCLRRLFQILQVHLACLFFRVDIERHLAAHQVTAKQFLGACLQTEHQPAVRVKTGHESVRHIDGVVTVDRRLRGVGDFVRSPVRRPAQFLLNLPKDLLVHLKAQRHNLLQRGGEHRLMRPDLRVIPVHQGRDTLPGDDARIHLPGACLREPRP